MAHIPAANILVECCRRFKYVFHTCHVGSIPTADRATAAVVEYCSAIKHILHVHYISHIPTANVLIECRCLMKHSFHSRGVRRIPAIDRVAAAIVKRGCIVKHVIHIRYVTDVPRSNILVKRQRSIESVAHISRL